MLSFADLVIENRERAERIMKTLHRMTAAHGATGPEAANAKARMADLVKKYGISDVPKPDEPARSRFNWRSSAAKPPPYRPKPQAQKTSSADWAKTHSNWEDLKRRRGTEPPKQEAPKASSGFDWHAFKAKEREQTYQKKAEAKTRKAQKRSGI